MTRPIAAVRTRRNQLLARSALAGLGVAVVLGATPALAQVTGVGEVASTTSNGGAVGVASGGGVTDITTNAGRSIVNWNSLNVTPTEALNFYFANRSDIVLNRVTGPASIDGVLNGCMATCATKGGNVWILSVSGVVIGDNAQISTGGFLASVGDVTNADFLDGDMNFAFTGYDEGAVEVAMGASINTSGGSIALIAPRVTTGVGSTVSASGAGNVLYGSATNYNVTFAPTADNDLDLISFEVPSQADGAGGLYGGMMILEGTTSGNRVFAAIVSKAGLNSTLLNTGAITATSAATDETGAIVLSNNRSIVGGTASASPIAGAGTGTISNHGVLTAVDVTLAAQGALLFSTDINAAGGDVVLSSDTGTVHQNSGVITADTLTASAAGDLVLAAGWSGTPNDVAKLLGLSSTGGDIGYIGTGFEIVGPITAPGFVGLETTGLFSGSGTVSSGSLSLNGAGTINVLGVANLDYSISQGNLTIHATGGIAMRDGWRLDGHQLTLISDTGSVIQSGDAIYSGGSLLVTAAGDIDFGESNYVTAFTGTSTGGDVSFRANGGVAVGATSALGQISLTSDTGSVTQTGGLTAASLVASAAAGITLLNASNDVSTIAGLSNSGLGDIVYGQTDSFQITGAVITANGGMSLTSTNGSITQTASGIITTSLLNANAGDDLILDQANAVGTVGNLTAGAGAGDDLVFNNTLGLTLSGLIMGDNVSLTSGGAITQTSFSTITANRLTASAAGDITIYDGSNNVATIGGLTSTSGDIVYRDVNGFDIQGNITANSTVNRGVMLVAGGTGAITQTSGVLDVGYFRGIAQSGITLGGANLIRRLISTTIGNGALTLNTTTDLSVAGTVAANAVSLSSTGAISQAANAQIWTNTLNASAVTGINLTASGSGANNIGALGTITNTTSGGITLSNAMNFNLTGNITASGQAVSITNTQGSISQTGGIITAGALSLSATTGITATRNNVVGSLGDVTAGGNFTFTNVGAIDLSGNVNVGANTVSLTSTTGHIVQSSGIITANVLNLSAGGAGGISLNRANAVASLGVVTSNGHILFRNEGNTVVGGDITAAGFDVTLRSNAGSVTQTAGSDITSNSLQVTAQTGATLTNAGNAINELAWVDIVNGGFAFGQTNGFLVGGPVRSGGGTVSLTSLSGGITQTTGYITGDTLTLAAAGAIDLDGDYNNVVNLGTVTTGGAFLYKDLTSFTLAGDVTAAGAVELTANNGGTIEQTGGIITAASIAAVADGDLLLGGANQITTVTNLDAGANLLYRQVADLTVPTISATGTVSLYSTTGDITQTGTITADTLVLGAFDDITLGQNFVAKLGQIDAGGDFDASNAGGLSSDALELTGDVTVGGAMTLVNLGAITQSGGGITAASLTIDTDGALTATGANSVTGATRLTVDGDVTWNSAGDVNLRVTTPGAASITSTGAILLDGGGASTVGGLLSLGAVTGISQAQTLNITDFGTLTNTTSGGINLTTAGWVELEGNVTAAGQSVALNVTTGGIIQNGGVITANRFSSTVTQGAFLYQINNVAQLGVIDAGSHNFTFRTLGDLLIDGDITSALTVSLTSATGGISQTAGSDITAGNLTVWAETGINLTNAGNDVDRLMTVINLGSGGIAYRQTDGFLIDSTIRALNQTVSLTSIAGGISETGTAFAQIEAGTLNASAAGALTLHRNNAVGTVSLNGTAITYVNVGSFAANVITGDTVSLTSNTGNITQTASTGRIVADSLTASAATGLEFFGGQNDIEFLAGLTSSGGGVTYRDMGGFEITGNISAAGQTVELVSDATGADGDDIVQTGGVITANLIAGTSAGDFLLAQANVVGQIGPLNAGGNLLYRGAGSLDLRGNLTAGSILELIADNGAIMQNGGAITADRLIATSTVGIGMARVNDVNELGDIDAGSGEFSFRDSDDLDLAGDITAGYGVTLQTGAALTQSGGSLTTPNLSVFSNTTAVLTGGSNDIDNLAISTAMGGLTFVDVDGFTITDRIYSSGTIDLTATTGDIDESATGYVSAQTLLVRAMSGNVVLTGDNAIEYLALMQATGDASFHDVDGFAITGNVSADALGLTTADGSIIQFGGTQITADSLYVAAVSGIVLGEVTNDVDTITGMVNATSGGILYADADSVNIDGAVTAAGQTVTFNVGTNLTQSYTGVITARTVAGSAGGAFALADAPNVVAQLGPVTANSIDLVTVDTGLTIVGALNATVGVTLKADDFITQTAAGTITGDSLRALADGDIILDQANDLNSITLLYSDLGDITYADVDGFSLDGSSLGDFWTNGTFTLTAGGTGDIEQSGVGLRATTLIATAGGNITLDEANRVTNLGAMTAGGYIYHYDFDDIAVAGDIDAGGSLNIVSINGDVTQTGGLITATTISGQSDGDFSLNNFDARLNSAISTTGDVDISNSGDIIIDNLVRVGAGNSVTLTSDGSISSNAAGRIEAGSLILSAGTYVNLNSAARNDVDTLASVTAGLSLNFIDDDDFSLSGDIDLNGGAPGTTATLRSVGGAITQTGGAIKVDGLLVEAATGVDLSGANLVGALEIANGSGDVYFTNAQDLGVVSANSGGLVDIETTVGRLDVLGQINAGSIVLTGANGAYAGDLLSATGDVTVTAVTGNAMAARIVSGDDVLVEATVGSAQLQSVSLYADVDPEADGQTVRVVAAGNAFLGATSEAGILSQTLSRVSGSGTVSVTSTGGDANVFLSSMDTPVDTLSAGGDGGTARAVLQNGDLSLGSVTGDNVSLTAHGGIVSATQVTVGGGDYDLTGADFSSGAITVSGTARDRTITDTSGDLALFTNVSAQRNLTITAQGSVLNGTGSVNITAGLGGQGGDLNITAASIAAYFVRGDGNVILTALSGGIDIGTVLVAGDYSLTGDGFFGGTLSPLGGKAGTWSLTALGALDFTGRTLSYRGDIDIQAADAITGGSVRSINGSVTVNGADDIDIENLYAETGVTVTAGDALTLDTVDSLDVEPYASDIALIGRSVTITGLLEAGADISVNAIYGAADIEAAAAGGDITIEASSGIPGEGNARLGSASLTGATGDLTITANNGDAILGAADYSLITTGNAFERAAGSTGAVTIVATSGGGAAVYLDHSANIDTMAGAFIDVTVESGDVSIGTMQALNDDVYAETLDGSLTIGEALATNGGVGLYAAGGDLVLTGQIHGGISVEIQTDGLLDGSLATLLSSGGDLQLVGGEVLLDRVSADGAVVIGALAGDLYVEFAEAGTGLGVISAGDATVRGAEVQDGINIQADGDIIFGADTKALITNGNYARVNAGGACGCGGDIYLESFNGNATVNLNSVVGTFDTIASGPLGDVNIAILSGGLTIYELAGYNITADVNGSLETIIGAFINGGNYSLTAGDFLGNVLTPDMVSGSMGDYTIIDTGGGLDMTGVSIHADGDILIQVLGFGALTGDAQLTAGGDLAITASGIAVDTVEAVGDVTLDAGNHSITVATSVTVGGDYSLTGADFLAETLNPLGAKAGDLDITDTGGNFVYSALSYAGDITVTTEDGTATGGGITSANGSIEILGYGADVGALSAVNGRIDIDVSGGAARVDSATALDDIRIITSTGNATLGAAALLGTGANSLLVDASGYGDAVLGSTTAGGITGANTFTSNGSTTTASVHAAGGRAYVYLATSDAITAVTAGSGNVGIAVTTGDFDLGSASSTGAIDIEGPDGQMTVGSLTADGNIDIHGADITLTDVDTSWNLFVTASGDLTFAGPDGVRSGRVAVDSWIVLEADDVTQDAAAGLDAIRLVVDATGDISLLGLNQVRTVGNVTGGSFAYRGVRVGGFDIGGSIDVGGGTVELIAENGGITQGGGHTIIAGSLTGSSQGGAAFAGFNYIDALGDFDNTGGAFFLNATQALTIAGTVESDSAVVIQTRGGGMTIASTGTVSSSASGDAVVLASDGVFTNDSGADAVQAANGRWLIYTQAMANPNGSTAGDTYGGLAGKTYYGTAYDFATGDFSGPINAGNRIVHAYQPILTVTPVSQTVTYNGQIPSLTATILGLVNGDLAADAWSGQAAIDGATSKNVGFYNLTAALGSLLSDMNYGFDFGTGYLMIDPKTITGTVNAGDKTYDATSDASGSITLAGVVAGDDVSATAASYSFADKNAGTDKTVTANGEALSGADAGNYVLDPLGVALADILRLTIGATVTADSKTYDGSAAATGSIVLNGVLAGDNLAIGGDLVFGDKNAGLAKAVTVANLAITGADAGNYNVTLAAAVADVLRKTLTGTFTANDKTYDGSAAATGALLVNGLIAGDDAAVTGTYSFADKNAGVDKVVTATVTVTGTDANNYELTPVGTDLATILRKTVAISVTVADKIYDGTAGATGTMTVTGLIAGDDASVTSGTYSFADANAGTDKAVTVAGIALAGSGAGNYQLTGVPSTLLADILRRQVAIRADDKTKLFGQLDPAFTFSITSGSLVSGQGFTGVLTREIGDAFGQYAITQGTVALGANYELVFTPGVLNIRPVPGGGQDGGDAFKYLREPSGLGLDWDPSEYLDDGDDREPVCLSVTGCSPSGKVDDIASGEAAPARTVATLGWRRFLAGAPIGAEAAMD